MYYEPGIWNVDAIRAAHPREAIPSEEISEVQEADSAGCSGFDKFKAEFEQLKHQVSLLQQSAALNTPKKRAL